MKALVITTLEPLHPGVEIWGTYWRFRLFLQSICDIADQVDILHLVGYRYMKENHEPQRLSAAQSAYLGLPVSAHLIGCRPARPQTIANYYLWGIASIYEQNEFYWYSGPRQVESVSRFLERAPDLVFVHRLSAMIPVLRCRRRPTPIFFDLDDIVHRVRLQAALTAPMRPGKFGHLCQVPAIALAERRAAALSRITFVCSELDRVRLNRLGVSRVAVVPNAVPFPPTAPALPPEPTILFLARCDYPPNIAAAERLIGKVFPRVRATIPDARLLIAGKATRDLPSARRRPEGVNYLGYVDDLAALYASSRLVCCPITSGSGTRVKLIEAAAYARPIVSTRFAAEGLDLRDGIEVLFREDDESLAAACVQLLKDDALSRNLAAEARRRVLQHYEANAVRRQIAELIS